MSTVRPHKTEWMIYGAYGYTGRLIAEEAARRGHRPIVAGRNRQRTAAVAEALGLRSRSFELASAEKIRAHLADCALVLNCAGPFSKTAAPMISGALAAATHYLDITGEIACLEAAAARHADAEAAEIALIPAVGFDVVPSDCLAAQVAARVPAPTHLQLAIRFSGAMSPGTAKTMIEMLPHGGRARIEGRIERVPVAWKAQRVPFADGPKWAMTIPWGDVSTAFYSTGITNIETYAAVSESTIRWLRRLRPLTVVTKLAAVEGWLKRQAERRLTGPTAQQRSEDHCELWASVTGRDGHTAAATMRAPEGYALTVQTALGAVEQLLAQPPLPGFSTPSMAFGKEFVEKFDGVEIRFA